MTHVSRLICLSALACLAAASAQAQQDYFSRDKYEAVADRAQPDYDPVAKRAGSFLLRPEAELGVMSVSNAFASSQDEVSDVIVRLGAKVRADSDWSRNRVSLFASSYRNEYLDNQGTSNSSSLIGAEGRIDATGKAWIAPRASYGWLSESRQDYVASFGTKKPIELERLDTGVDAHYQTGRIRAVAGIGLLQEDYKDAELLGSSIKVDQDFRDRTYTRLRGRLDYGVTPNVAVFGQAVAYQADYDDEVVIDGVARNRDSDGYILSAGVDFETQALLRGQVGVGLFNDRQKDAFFADKDGLSVDGRVTWFASQLTNVTVSAGRRTVDLGLRESASAVQTSFGLELDHELRRNILLRLSGRLLNEDYDDIDRQDEVSEFGFLTLYKLNRHMHLDGFVRHVSRDVSGTAAATGRTYDNTIIGVSLRLYP